jgi:sporulation protein YlmC with PRC-barrel domain
MDQMTQERVAELGHPLVLSSRVTGTPVYDQAGNRLGHVDDLSIEKETGRTIYAIVSFGGFLGVGQKFHPVPWALLTYDVDQGGFVVPLTEASLKGAPNYDAAEIRALGGPEHRTYGDTIYGYYGTYGVTPYW